MGKMMNLIFITIFSGVGWSVGEPFGMGTAIFLSLIFSGIGWLAAKRFMRWLDE